MERIAVSNIAWDSSEELEIAKLLQAKGIKNLEIAPTKVFWDEPVEATDKDIDDLRQFWGSYGIEVVAFQSMLFKRPEAQILGDNSQETADYLMKFVELGGRMGISAMVFGSPKNRQKGEKEYGAAINQAVDFFRGIGNTASRNNVFFCIEPNPEQYGCDFITNSQEGMELVDKIDNPGIALHLDMAGMALAQENIYERIAQSKKMLRHFHVSAPYLDQVEARDDIDYVSAARALKDINYSGYISIEMRPGEIGSNAERIAKAVEFTQSTFGSV